MDGKGMDFSLEAEMLNFPNFTVEKPDNHPRW